MLTIENLARPGLEPANLQLARSECAAVFGPSGSGKSLLLRAIADLDPSTGRVSLDGKLRETMPAPAWRRRVCYVPADSGWWADDVGGHFADEQAATGVLHLLGLPAAALDWPVERLSTGERQRLALIRALVQAPDVLLLDEPTSGLDAEATARVEGVLHERLADGAAILLVTHDPQQAARMAQHRYEISNGKLRPTDAAGEGGRVTYIALDYVDLAVAAAVLVINAGLSLVFRLGLARRLVIAVVRMVVQLTLVGLVLKTLFALHTPWLTGLAALVMVGFAGREAVARQDRSFIGFWTYGIGTTAMFMAAMTVTLFALTTQFDATTWYDPRYAIPLLGMILGNTMNGVSLGLDRLLAATVSERRAIEARLCLGASARTALHGVVRQAIRAGMIPTINAMAATGLVSLPGMMTGQILAGVEPEQAVKYQLLVMFLIGGGTALGVFAAVMGGAHRLFDDRHRLRLDRLRHSNDDGD